MNQVDRVSYARNLAVYGERVNVISQEFSKLDLEHKDHISMAASLGKVSLLLERCEETLRAVRNMPAPQNIQKQHHQLVQAFEMWVNGSRMIKQSITVYADGSPNNAGELDTTKFLEGFRMQRESEDATYKAITAITERI